LDISDLAPISGPRQTRNGDRATAPARPSRISLRVTWNPRRANMFDSPSLTRHIRPANLTPGAPIVCELFLRGLTLISGAVQLGHRAPRNAAPTGS